MCGLRKLLLQDKIMRMLYQGLSDVATILARRVAVEFSDSDDCPSNSEHDSDDWGEYWQTRLKVLL